MSEFRLKSYATCKKCCLKFPIIKVFTVNGKIPSTSSVRCPVCDEMNIVENYEKMCKSHEKFEEGCLACRVDIDSKPKVIKNKFRKKILLTKRKRT